MRRLLTLLIFLLALLAAPSSALAAEGDTTFRSCVSGTGASGCTTDALLGSGIFNAAYSVSYSPDGKNAYVGTFFSDGSLVAFTVNQSTGALTRIPGQTGCYRETPVASDCLDGNRMVKVTDVRVSPDGKNVYATGYSSASIAVFDRNATTGKLTQKAGTAGCVSQTGGGGCGVGRSMNSPLAITLDKDGKNLYALHEGGAVTVFDRAANGTLTQKALSAGCVSNGGADGCSPGRAIGGFATELGLSADGRHLYAPARSAGGILLFNRDTTNGEITQKGGIAGCVTATGSDGSTAGQCVDGSNDLADTRSVVLDPTGKNVYAMTSNGVVASTRASDGLLTQTSCITESGSAGACTDGTALSDLWGAAISPDGRDLAVGDFSSGASAGLRFFRRNTSTGALTQAASTARCTTQSGSSSSGAGTCLAQGAMGGYGRVAYHPSGLYVLAARQEQGAVVTFERDFAPVCQNRSLGVPFNTTVGVQFGCSDLNGDALTYSITRSPSAGQTGAINQGAAQVFYSPFNGFSGGDSFDYRATARGANSNIARVNLSIAGPPAPPPGGGGGGTPPPSGPTLIPSTVTNKWLAFPNFTKASNLSVNNLPAGATVRVTCKTKKKKQQKKGCPYKSKRVAVAVARAKLNLRKPFAKKRLPVGTKITITITAPNMIGKRFSYTVRKRAVPKVSTRCLPPGGKASRCV
jgi:WD40 repeat protein